MRCDIAEDEDPAAAREKLRATLDGASLAIPEERAWVEPRLAHLLGLEEGAPGDQENLFSAWRILFERLAETSPTILVFEDMQWADSGLLDFLEYLLEWSRSHPLFVLVLARPELADKRPAWGGGKRSFASIYLEPLSRRRRWTSCSRDSCRASRKTCARVSSPAPKASPSTRSRPSACCSTADSSSAKETPTARPARSASSRCPRRCTLSSPLVWTDLRRRSGASSKTEPCSGRRSPGWAWRRSPGSTESDLEPLLGALVRKEVLAIQADPRSPERGQYAFLQDIVRHVAYETLSKRERKAKHLGAAQFLESLPSADEGRDRRGGRDALRRRLERRT